ncbi:MAG: archease [Halobacteriaceae archaeon]
MTYSLEAHTADIAVAAEGEGLEATVAAVADGMAAAMCEAIPTAGGERFSIRETAESQEALLFEYLDRLIFERDVRGVLPVDNEVTLHTEEDGSWVLEGTARGVPLNRIEGREVKAVTYSEMELTETDDGWRAYVVFDV